jgi:hypothetical protein
MYIDYIPRSVLKFIVWGELLFAYILERYKEWDAPDPTKYLKPSFDLLKEKQRLASGVNAGRIDIVKQNDALKAAQKAFRTYIQGFIAKNPNVSHANRRAMGLPERDAVPTVHPRPTAVPDVAVETTAYHYQHRVRATNAETGKTVKPEGVHGVRYAWQAGGERPATGAAMVNGKFTRRTEYVVIHNDADRGKLAYYAACYENSRGEAGPWSAIEEAYIG